MICGGETFGKFTEGSHQRCKFACLAFDGTADKFAENLSTLDVWPVQQSAPLCVLAMRNRFMS